MTAKNWQSTPLEELLAEYTRAAISRLKEKNPKLANRQSLVVAGIDTELRRRGPEAEKRLISLLEHPDVGVRLMAAGHLLDVAPDRAEPVLLDLSKQRNLVGVSAGAALDAWRDGTRKLK